MSATTIDEVIRRIEGVFDDRMLRDIITGFGWRGRRGVAVELGPHSFMLDAFFGSIDDVATALRVALRNEDGPFTLLGARDKMALLRRRCQRTGTHQRLSSGATASPCRRCPNPGARSSAKCR